MITLHAFGRVHPFVHGYTRDLRIQWALEEMGLDYEVRGWDHTGGETMSPEFSAISPFNQIPILSDDGLVLSETGAILIHLADKSGRLMPADPAGRAHVLQWTFAALATVEGPIQPLVLMDFGAMGDPGEARGFLVDWSRRVLGNLERRLDGRDWLATDDFTVADLLTANILHAARKTGLMSDYPKVQAFHDRAHARPAWSRALDLYADRLGADRSALD